MKKLLILVACLVAAWALAGDVYIGTIASTTNPDAGTNLTKDNTTTATSFAIPSMSKVSIQCDSTTYVATDVVSGATATNGIKVGTDQLFLTTVGARKSVTDAGLPSANISIIGTGTAAVACKVFVRRGDE